MLVIKSIEQGEKNRKIFEKQVVKKDRRHLER